MRKLQTATKMENRINILKVLADNQWHGYKEIREKANISNVTLSEHLKELKPLLNKRRDPSASRLSAQYKIKQIFALALTSNLVTGIGWKEIEKQYLKGKDFKSVEWDSVVESINMIANQFLLHTPMICASEDFFADGEEKNLELLELLLETFVWENYRILTWNLIKAMYYKLKKESSNGSEF